VHIPKFRNGTGKILANASTPDFSGASDIILGYALITQSFEVKKMDNTVEAMSRLLNGMNASGRGDDTTALGFYDEVLQELPTSDTEPLMKIFWSLAAESKGNILEKQGFHNEAKRQLDMATQARESTIFEDKQLEVQSYVETAILYDASGQVDKAIACADKVNASVIEDKEVAGDFCFAMAAIYSKRPETRGKSKKALLDAMSNLEKNEVSNIDKLIQVHEFLARLSANDREEASALCTSAWARVERVGIEHVDLAILHPFCLYAFDTSPEKEILAWHQHRAILAERMLEVGYEPFGAANLYVIAKSIEFVTNLKENKPADASLVSKCLKVFENHPRVSITHLAFALWLQGYELSKDSSWPTDCLNTKKAARLLKKAVHMLKDDGLSGTPVFASAQGLIADTYFASEDYASAATLYEEAKNILTPSYASDNCLIQRYASKIEQAQDILDMLVETTL
jgi:tetratricopeptide (TPR) repeat protein